MEVIRDIAFGPHERQAYNFHLPEGAEQPLPVVVFFHPGAWQRRDKRAVRTMFVLEHGFALVSIGYRLAQHARFPAQVQDVNEELRHLIAHAADYGIDPDRMVLAGTSAGAHLASLAVLAKDHAAFHPVEGLAPRGIVSVYGAYDMPGLLEGAAYLSTDHVSAESPLGMMFGAPPLERTDLLREISPASFIRRDAPPFLILHGREDHVLPWQQSADFAYRLIETGVNATLQVVPHVGHGHEAFCTGHVADEITAFAKRVTGTS